MADKKVWRFQADLDIGDTDPMVTCFLGIEETDEDTGETSIRQDTRDPVTMPLSELAAAIAGDHKAIAQKQAQAKAKAAARMNLDAKTDASV